MLPCLRREPRLGEVKSSLVRIFENRVVDEGFSLGGLVILPLCADTGQHKPERALQVFTLGAILADQGR